MYTHAVLFYIITVTLQLQSREIGRFTIYNKIFPGEELTKTEVHFIDTSYMHTLLLTFHGG